MYTKASCYLVKGQASNTSNARVSFITIENWWFHQLSIAVQVSCLLTVIMFVSRDDLMATSGATHGLHMIAHLLFSPGDIAFVENPTYFLANTMFKEDAGLVLKGG